MANLGRILRDEIAKSVAKAMRAAGLSADIRKIRAQLVVLEKRVATLEKSPARSTPSRAGRKVDNEKALGACEIIGQENATAVWVKGLFPMTPDEHGRLPAACWRK